MIDHDAIVRRHLRARERDQRERERLLAERRERLRSIVARDLGPLARVSEITYSPDVLHDGIIRGQIAIRGLGIPIDWHEMPDTGRVVYSVKGGRALGLDAAIERAVLLEKGLIP